MALTPKAKSNIAIGAGLFILVVGAFFGIRYLTKKSEEKKTPDETGGGGGAGTETGKTQKQLSDEKRAARQTECKAILATAGRGNPTSEQLAEIERCKNFLGIKTNAPVAAGVGRGDAILAGQGRGADGLAEDFA